MRDVGYLVERNLIDFVVQTAVALGGTVSKHKYFSSARGEYSQWYSFVFDFNVPDSDLEEAVELLKLKIKLNELPNHLLIRDDPKYDKLVQELQKNKFSVFHSQQGMAVDLTNFDPGEYEYPKELKILTDDDKVEQWAETTRLILKKYNATEIFKALAEKYGAKMYGMVVDGNVVSTAMMFCWGEVAGVHEVSTLEDYRKRGYTTTIIRKLLTDAKNEGYKTCVLQASQMGRRIYKKFGFEDTNIINHYSLEL